MPNVLWKKSDLTGSSIQEATLKEFYTQDCNWNGSSFFRTTLNGIDFRTSQIEGIVVQIEDVKGCTVTPMQAVDLAELMGLIVK